MQYVVDASVAFKWLLPEVHAAEAESLLSNDVELLAPDLIHAEIGNVLWKRVVSRDISREKAKEALRQFMAIEIDTTPTSFLVDDALELACQYRRSIYDSLYLALAVMSQARLVTADKRLYNALQKTPLARSIAWIADVRV